MLRKESELEEFPEKADDEEDKEAEGEGEGEDAAEKRKSTYSDFWKTFATDIRCAHTVFNGFPFLILYDFLMKFNHFS